MLDRSFVIGNPSSFFIPLDITISSNNGFVDMVVGISDSFRGPMRLQEAGPHHMFVPGRILPDFNSTTALKSFFFSLRTQVLFLSCTHNQSS